MGGQQGVINEGPIGVKLSPWARAKRPQTSRRPYYGREGFLGAFVHSRGDGLSSPGGGVWLKVVFMGDRVWGTLALVGLRRECCIHLHYLRLVEEILRRFEPSKPIFTCRKMRQV